MTTKTASAPSPEPLLVSRRTAARMLDCCQATLDTMLHEGILKSVRLGSRVLVSVAELRRFCESGGHAQRIRKP